MKKALVIQGPNSHGEKIKECYKNLPVIFSTLEDENVSNLYDSNFTIIKNKKPAIPGRLNFNYQVTNTLNGIKKAKELGYEYIFKIRSDITIKEIEKLLNLLENEKDVIYFSAYHNWDGGYLCEHMLYGKTEVMEKLWSVPTSSSNLPPETQLTNSLKNNLSNLKIKFIFPILYSNNILAFWEKRSFYLNDYKKDKLFTYDEFSI